MTQTEPHHWVTALNELVVPTKPIPAAASSINHLVESDFKWAKSKEKVLSLLEYAVPEEAIVVGHNSDFDKAFVAPALADRQWLDTLRLGRHLAPESDNHKNATLYYHLGGKKITWPLHDAAGDCAVTAAVLDMLVERYLAAGHPDDVEALIAFAELPILFPRMWLGKHKGKPFDEIKIDYLCWALDSLDLDRDQRFTIEHHIDEKRRMRRERFENNEVSAHA
jgi:exodeoxyribonuclease X